MTRRATGTSAYDTERLASDLANQGLLPIDLSRRAGVAHTTAYRALRGEVTPRMLARLARALGYSVRRYLVRRPSHRSAA